MVTSSRRSGAPFCHRGATGREPNFRAPLELSLVESKAEEPQLLVTVMVYTSKLARSFAGTADCRIVYLLLMSANEIDPAIAEGQAIVKRLLLDQESAHSSWAHFTALDRAYSHQQSAFKAKLDWLSLSSRLTSLADALIRDTILALLRMTDSPNKDCVTLCGISTLLADATVQQERICFFEQLPFATGEDCRRKISLILDLVPQTWPPKSQLRDTRLSSLRTELRPIRDKLIAHAIPFERIQLLVPRVDDFLFLNSELVSAAQWIFEGAAPSNLFATRLRETEEFWAYVVRGFTESER